VSLIGKGSGSFIEEEIEIDENFDEVNIKSKETNNFQKIRKPLLRNEVSSGECVWDIALRPDGGGLLNYLVMM
jgi:hypothetical protein